MKNVMKRILSLTLALMMVVSLIPTTVFAAEGEDTPVMCETAGCILEAHGESAHKYCNTTGCTVTGAHESASCVVPSVKCATEGCILDAHEGDAHKYCNTTGCTVTGAHEADSCVVPSVKCATEGCILDAHEGDAHKYCNTEGCKLAATGKHDTCDTSAEEPVQTCDGSEDCPIDLAGEHQEGCLKVVKANTPDPVEVDCDGTDGCEAADHDATCKKFKVTNEATFKKALEAKLATITLESSITMTSGFTVPDGVTIDLNQKTLTTNVESNYLGNCVIKNGTIEITSDSYTGDGLFHAQNGKTAEFNNVKIHSDGFNAHSLFHLENSGIVKLLNNSVIDMENNAASSDTGRLFYCNTLNGKVIVTDSSIHGKNAGSGAANGSFELTRATVDITGTSGGNMEHGFNGSNLTIMDSNLTISGGTGRGISVGRSGTSSLVVSGNSSVAVSNMAEASIKIYNAADTVIIAETAEVTVDKPVVNEKNVAVSGGGEISLPSTAEVNQGLYAAASGTKGESSYREALKVDLSKVYAKKKLEVKIYSGTTLLATTTLREADRDDANAKLYPVNASAFTVNIVLEPTRKSGSWDTVWAEGLVLSNLNLPDKIEVYADGKLTDTYNGGVTKDYINTYYAFDNVKYYTVKIGDQGYETLADAVAATPAGAATTITVLENITVSETVVIPEGKNVVLDLNGKNVIAAATLTDCIIKNKGALTITGNGIMDASAITTDSVKVIDNYGTLTIQNGTFKGATSNFSYALRNCAGTMTIDTANVVSHFGAVGVNGGKVTVKGGSFEVTSKAGGHALYVANGEAVVKGGTFTPKSDNYSYAIVANHDNAKVTVEGGTFNTGMNRSTASLTGNIEIKGGTFNGEIFATNGDYTVSGGTFAKAVDEDYCADGFTPVKNENGTYGVATLPNAEVKNLGPMNVQLNGIFNGSSFTSSSETIPLSVVMEFIAKDSAEEAQKNSFGHYTTDFYIEMLNMDGDSIVMDDDCYLAGYYGSFGWIKVPLTGLTITENKIYPVITTVGLNFSYEDICTSVKDFMCGIHLSDEVIADNPDLQVSLTLALSEEPLIDDPAYLENPSMKISRDAFIQVDEPYVYDTDALLAYVAFIDEDGDGILDNDEDKFTSIQAAVTAAVSGDIILVMGPHTLASTENPITVPAGKSVVLDLGGNTVTMPGIMNYGTLEVKNGTIVGNRADYSVVENNGADAKLTVNFTAKSERHAIRADGGTVTVNGGSYITLGNYKSTIHALNASSGAKVTIKGGTFVGPMGTPNADSGSAINSKGSGTVVTIQGGSFSGGKNWTLSGETKDHIVVTGGIFDQDPSASGANESTEAKNYVADGYGVTEVTGGFKVHKHEFETTWTENDAKTHHYHACTEEGCEEQSGYGTHTGGSATCKDQAVCATCSLPYGDTIGHDMEPVTEIKPTPSDVGTKAHFQCAVCKQRFLNETDTVPATAEQLKIGKLVVVSTGIAYVSVDGVDYLTEDEDVYINLTDKDVVGEGNTNTAGVNLATGKLKDLDGDLIITTTTGEITFNNKAIKALCEEAKCAGITIFFYEGEEEDMLTADQKAALKTKKLKDKSDIIRVLVLDCDGKKLASKAAGGFGEGGKVYIEVDHSVDVGTKSTDYSAYCITDKLTAVGLKFLSKTRAQITLEHLSDYIIARPPKATISANTGDSSNILLWAGICAAAAVALGGVLIVAAKNKKK